jgi:hypothetical protein
MIQVIDIAYTSLPASPFAGRVQQDQLRVDMTDGSSLTGSFLTQAGMAFLHVRDGSVHGRVEGPIDPAAVRRVVLLKGRDEIVEERRLRKLGDLVPGTLRKSREGYEARLDALARAAAMATGRRRDEIEAQFDLVADEISLAKTKRNFMLAAARWNRFSNREPTKMDLCGGDMTSAERFSRPRPQDFDPDPKIRRARVPIPPAIAADPRSVPNMMKALRAAGFRALPSIVGETTFEEGDLLVDFPGGKEKGRFALIGRRNPSGNMAWRALWEGNSSRADMRRRSRALRSEDYRKFVDIIRDGLAPTQELKDTLPKPRKPKGMML